MTTDRRQANADVARAMGWTQRDNHGEPCYYGEPPDLYADTPEGAKAREDAETWLLKRQFYVRAHSEFGPSDKWPDGGFQFHVSGPSLDRISFYVAGATVPEARANAIVAAVRVMLGGKLPSLQMAE